MKVKRLGEGSYGTVFLAIDTKPEGIKRKIDPKYLNLLDKVEDPAQKKTYNRYDDGDVEMSEDQKEAVKVLGNK